MLDFIIIASFIVTILLIWFETDAVAEYLNIFNLKHLIKKYNANKTANTLQQFLAENKFILANNNKLKLFYIKLLTCPYCINFWLCLLGSTLLHKVQLTPVLYITTLFVFFKITKRV